MFSFISFRRIAQSAFAILVMLCLSSALFTSCKDDPEEESGYELDSRLIGTWSFTGEYGADGYIIKTTTLSYFDEFGLDYDGTIEYVSNFSNTAGVIIIKYTSVGDWLDPTNIGKYIGVYYKNLNPNISVQMGTAYIEGGAEEATLDAAKTAFTVGKEGTYMSYYGTYLKQ
jgi:hypothetical protein